MPHRCPTIVRPPQYVQTRAPRSGFVQQRATANMVHWLTLGFGLARQEANVLIGTTARFDIASIVCERGKTVACKIPKAMLRQLIEEKP